MLYISPAMLQSYTMVNTWLNVFGAIPMSERTSLTSMKPKHPELGPDQ